MGILVYGDTITCPELRHELPLAILDPLLYLEVDGRRGVLTHALEDARIAEAAPQLERLLEDDLGRDELLASGRPRGEVERELCARAAVAFGVRDALVPPGFPLALADRLRDAGLALTVDEREFEQRRRRKTAAEMAGIRRAADVAMQAMAHAAAMLRDATIEGDVLALGGETLTAETVRAAIRELCSREGAPTPADIIVRGAGPRGAIGHEPGSGPLPAGEPIEIDLWPQDEASGCWADMTRTFVRGEIGDAVARLHEVVLTAHERSCTAACAGVVAEEVYGVACEVFEAAGQPTQRTKRGGETLREGFYFSLGHGVGLEVHEPPVLGRGERDPLIAGEVLAIEPGTFLAGIGGTRVEDLVVVGESGCERLTGSFPYGLAP